MGPSRTVAREASCSCRGIVRSATATYVATFGPPVPSTGPTLTPGILRLPEALASLVGDGYGGMLEGI